VPDFRAATGRAFLRIGDSLARFFKIGKLNFPSSSNSIAEMFMGGESIEREFWQAYEKNVWAYRGINAIAEAMGQLPIRVMRKSAAGNLTPVPNHRFQQLLDDPNPFMSKQDLVELLTIFLESTGDGYWLFDDGKGTGRTDSMKLSQVIELWPLPSHHMKAIPDAKEFIKRNGEFTVNIALIDGHEPVHGALVVGRALLGQSDSAVRRYTRSLEGECACRH